MTLERHRSKLIPEISLDADGKLSVGRTAGRRLAAGPPGAPPGGGQYLSEGLRGPPGAPPDGNGQYLSPVDEYERYSERQNRKHFVNDDRYVLFNSLNADK